MNEGNEAKNSTTASGESPRPALGRWVFTFGSGHKHPVTGKQLDHHYVVIEGDASESRRIMENHFGYKWAFQYRSEEEAGVERFGLTRIDLPASGQSYRLTRDTLYCAYFNGQPLTCTLSEGETCSYFAHSDTYIFEHRDSLEGARIVPYYHRPTVEAWSFWFEAVTNTQRDERDAETSK